MCTVPSGVGFPSRFSDRGRSTTGSLRGSLAPCKYGEGDADAEKRRQIYRRIKAKLKQGSLRNCLQAVGGVQQQGECVEKPGPVGLVDCVMDGSSGGGPGHMFRNGSHASRCNDRGRLVMPCA